MVPYETTFNLFYKLSKIYLSDDIFDIIYKYYSIYYNFLYPDDDQACTCLRCTNYSLTCKNIRNEPQCVL